MTLMRIFDMRILIILLYLTISNLVLANNNIFLSTAMFQEEKSSDKDHKSKNSEDIEDNSEEKSE